RGRLPPPDALLRAAGPAEPGDPLVRAVRAGAARGAGGRPVRPDRAALTRDPRRAPDPADGRGRRMSPARSPGAGLDRGTAPSSRARAEEPGPGARPGAREESHPCDGGRPLQPAHPWPVLHRAAWLTDG